MRIRVIKRTIIGSANVLGPGRRQAIIWTKDGLLSIEPLEYSLKWNFNQNSNILIQENAFECVVRNWSFCFGINVLTHP